MSIPVILFAVIAIATAVSALGVVLSRNIVRAAVWLLFTLIGVSLTYFLLGAEFVGAAQLIVYVGGTLVLVVFGVMLTAQGPLQSLRTRPAEWAVGAVLGTALFALLLGVALGPSGPKGDARWTHGRCRVRASRSMSWRASSCRCPSRGPGSCG